MTLIFGGYPVSSEGGGGSISTDFTYPYSALWIYKRSMLENEQVTDEILKANLVCNLGQATDFNVVGEGDGLTCTFEGKTIELYEDTNDASDTFERAIGKYGDDDIVVCNPDAFIWDGNILNSVQSYFAYAEIKQYIFGIEPEPEPGPA